MGAGGLQSWTLQDDSRAVHEYTLDNSVGLALEGHHLQRYRPRTACRCRWPHNQCGAWASTI
jgi:hypothetical protein